jgi:PadR family transcriptional regulator PadR
MRKLAAFRPGSGRYTPTLSTPPTRVDERRLPTRRKWATSTTYVGDMCRLQYVKLTAPLERVLLVFLADLSARRYGYDLMKAAKLPSGTLYPMLARLEEQGLVASKWEPRREDASGRPPRKYYQLTDEGVRVARLELAQASQAAARAGYGTARPARGSAG